MPIILTHADNSKHAEIRKENQQMAEELAALKQQLREDAKKTREQAVQPEGAHLVVNGQVRKIGKKSQYLLDMLTLPED